MRKRARPHHENHDRWLVSYADFITLMFAFFVVLFASSNADQQKTREVADSVRAALARGPLSVAMASVLGHPKPGQLPKGTEAPKGVLEPLTGPPAMDLSQALEALRKGLGAALDEGKMKVTMEPRGLVVSMREAAFFASGDDSVSPSSFPALEKVASVIQNLPNSIRLEGHSDNIPIHTARFRSNWELSTARAIAMLEVFEKRYKVTRQRMAVAGYAETSPADSNQTLEGRARNRRVDLVVLTYAAMKSEPSQSAQPQHAAPTP